VSRASQQGLTWWSPPEGVPAPRSPAERMDATVEEEDEPGAKSRRRPPQCPSASGRRRRPHRPGRGGGAEGAIVFVIPDAGETILTVRVTCLAVSGDAAVVVGIVTSYVDPAI